MAGKVLLIGRINLSGTMFDGQTVKTRTLFRLLRERYGDDSVMCVETEDYKHHPLHVLKSFIVGVGKCDDIVVLLSRNGRRLFFPLLSFLSRHSGKRVYHNLIGGALLRDIENDPKCVQRLNSFVVNWVESPALARELCERGVSNARYLPNFKQFGSHCVNSGELLPPFRFCTFSRVSETKGILEAIIAVESLNKLDDCKEYHLDVYGPIEDGFDDELNTALSGAEHVCYRGVVPAEDSLEIVSQYHALLFPTTWMGEGMPGTIIDALASGTPIVASHWTYYWEMLEDGVTGYGYPIESPNMLSECILKLLSDENAYRDMINSCLMRADYYSADRVISFICTTIDAGRIIGEYI